jgi:acyl-[acyl carrier protein]--UDP-N-acetylglucosamine O-acyltransferase
MLFALTNNLKHRGSFLVVQVVGDNNLIMGSCHIAHDCKLGNQNILANGTLVGGHVIIEVSL